jgi:hypothetical protein
VCSVRVLLESSLPDRRGMLEGSVGTEVLRCLNRSSPPSDSPAERPRPDISNRFTPFRCSAPVEYGAAMRTRLYARQPISYRPGGVSFACAATSPSENQAEGSRRPLLLWNKWTNQVIRLQRCIPCILRGGHRSCRVGSTPVEQERVDRPLQFFPRARPDYGTSSLKVLSSISREQLQDRDVHGRRWA